MKISRLDHIINNNVTGSAKFNEESQKIFVLQDISETLAMIYDKLCESSEKEVEPFVIPYDELENFSEMYFEPLNYDGYDVDFDTVKNADETVVKAFGHDMPLKRKEYGKKYRCWNVMPNEEQRSMEVWRSF